jgi:hypothetical protein
LPCQTIVFFLQELNHASDIRHFGDPSLHGDCSRAQANLLRFPGNCVSALCQL